MASLPTILLLLAALSAGATVIAAIIAFRSQREASSAIFPIVREEERNRAQRARISIFVWIAVTALFIGGWLGTLRLSGSAESAAGPAEASPTAAAVIEAQPTPAPASTATPVLEPTATAAPLQNQEPTSAPPTDTPPPAATDTPVPSATATATPPPTATATNTNTPLPPSATPLPSATPTATPTSTPTRVPLPGERVPAPAGVRVGPIQFSAELDSEQSPVNPATTFTDGLAQVYGVFSFKGLEEGLPFKIIWYKNGAEIARDEGQWEWGRQGQSFVFLSPKGPGLYKLELWVNDTVVATKLFEITPRPK